MKIHYDVNQYLPANTWARLGLVLALAVATVIATVIAGVAFVVGGLLLALAVTVAALRGRLGRTLPTEPIAADGVIEGQYSIIDDVIDDDNEDATRSYADTGNRR